MSSDIADWHDYGPEDSDPEAPLTGSEVLIDYADILETLDAAVSELAKLADDLDTATAMVQAVHGSLTKLTG